MRSIVIALGVGLAIGLGGACDSAREFACADDSECDTDESRGWCEDTGWCAFPHSDCESGRMYGHFARDGLADTCVPAASTTEDDGATSSGSTSDAPDPSATAASDTGSSGSSSGSGDGTSGDEAGSSAGDDDSPVACPTGFLECDGDPDTYCESSLASATTCGSCDHDCTAAGRQFQCVDGTCVGDIEVVADADTFVELAFPDANHGGQNPLQVDLAPSPETTLIHFEPPVLDPGMTVEQVRLVMTCSEGGNPVEIHAVTEAWNELEVTWNTQPAIDPVAIATMPGTTGFTDVDLTDVAGPWLDGTQNHGIALVGVASDGIQLRSREYIIDIEHPRVVLSVTF